MTTTFTPGEAVGICGPTACLIAGIKLDDPRLPRLWEVLSRGDAGAVDGVLDLLLEGGFAAMPAFAVAATSGTTTRVVVRHPASVEAIVDGASTIAGSTPGGTWSDVTLEGASTLELRAGAAAATAVRLPFHAGMTPASSVRVVLEQDGAEPAPGPRPAVSPGAPADATEVSADATEASDGAAEAVPTEVSSGTAGSAPARAPSDATQSGLSPQEAPTHDDGATSEEAPGHDDAAIPEQPTAAADDEREAGPLTAIWKGQEAPAPDQPTADGPPAPDEAVEETVDEGAEEEVQDETPSTDEPDGSTVLRPVQPPLPPAPAPASAPAPKKGGLIDGVPWLTADWSAASSTPAPPKPTYETPSRPTPPPPPAPKPVAPPAPPTPPAPVAAAPSSDADDEGEGDDAPTVLRAELVKELGSAGIVGPSVLAVDCPNGHQTSAHEPTCRLCGAPVSDSQEPRQIPRPPLGALVLASGDRLVLDKDAVLGRAPHEPEGSTERPHLLRVGDNGDISRQHARILLDGWHVIVRDLGTANGTTLTLPGGNPQQLRANEDYQLEDGAEIGIADVVTLRYEVKP